jgi:hypothetical protein
MPVRSGCRESVACPPPAKPRSSDAKTVRHRLCPGALTGTVVASRRVEPAFNAFAITFCGASSRRVLLTKRPERHARDTKLLRHRGSLARRGPRCPARRMGTGRRLGSGDDRPRPARSSRRLDHRHRVRLPGRHQADVRAGPVRRGDRLHGPALARPARPGTGILAEPAAPRRGGWRSPGPAPGTPRGSRPSTRSPRSCPTATNARPAADGGRPPRLRHSCPPG